MNIEISRKQDLNEDQLKYIDQRISDKCHENDMGPITCWKTYANGMFAAIDQTSGQIVALIDASGPSGAVNPGWWVDSKFRGRGYGKAVVIELARYLKGQGYTDIGHIRVQTYHQKYDSASQKLKEIFINEFTHS